MYDGRVKNLKILITMKKVTFILICLLFCCTMVSAQEKSELQKQAEAIAPGQNNAQARSLYIRAFNDYVNKGQTRQGVECGVKGVALYYKENAYKEAFDLLREIDQVIGADRKASNSEKAAMRYLTTKERMQMYLKLKRTQSVKDNLASMENLAKQAGDENVDNDLLYCKAIFYYSIGQNAQGNAVFKEMADKLTASKEYDKVDEVYQTLIANGRRSGNANMVAQSYSNYIAWKDSANAMKVADQIGALNKQIADHETTIEEKDSKLSSRQTIIVSLSILAAILAGALVVGAIILLRFIVLTRKQKKIIALANETNALKAKFISNISAHLEPSLKKLDTNNANVKAMLDFTSHIQTLSELENTSKENIELTEIQVHPFCEAIMEEIRCKVKSNVTLTVNAQKMSVNLNKAYVSHILTHLLSNAAAFTPEEGTICLEFKKRSPHTYQFLVSNTGEVIPEEKRDDLFKPFVEMHDLSKGDGLGLPICKQMALKMDGDLELDTKFTKGTRFVLDLHV